MSQSISDVWTRELAAPVTEAAPVEMTFDGLPCKVRPLGMDFYIRSGRIPSHFARMSLFLQQRNVEEATRALESVHPDELIKGEEFKRAAVCRVMVEPRVVDVPPGQQPEGAFSYMELAERRPAFVDGLLFWLMVGCPVPVKGGEGEGLDAEALGNFSEDKGRTKRQRARRNRKGHGKDAAGVNTPKPA